MTDKAIQKANPNNPNVDDVDALVRRTMFANQPADLVNMTLLICQRYDLDPLLKHVVLIKGNIYVTRDGLLHVAHQSGQLNGMHVTLGKDDFGMFAECTIYRRDMAHPFTYRVYRDEYDSKTGAWRTHPRAMLIKTAEVFTLRRAFDVALTPIEEMDTVIDCHQPDPPSPSIATQARPSPSIATQAPPSPSIATQARPVEGEVVGEGGPEPKASPKQRPYDAETFRKGYTILVNKSRAGNTPSDKQVQYVRSLMSSAFKDSSTARADRLAVLEWLTGRTITSTKDLTGAEASVLIDILRDETGEISREAYQEMQNCLVEAMKAQGQGELFPDQPEDIPA